MQKWISAVTQEEVQLKGTGQEGQDMAAREQVWERETFADRVETRIYILSLWGASCCITYKYTFRYFKTWAKF
jgi:hypothetical protein